MGEEGGSGRGGEVGGEGRGSGRGGEGKWEGRGSGRGGEVGGEGKWEGRGARVAHLLPQSHAIIWAAGAAGPTVSSGMNLNSKATALPPTLGFRVLA